MRVEALLLGSTHHEEGLAAFQDLGGDVVDDVADTRRPDVVVDGIVGIGGRPGLRPEAVAALEALDGVPVVAVDVPSGVDVDTGELDGPHVIADLTVTFGTHKVAHLVDPAAGRVRGGAPRRPRAGAAARGRRVPAAGRRRGPAAPSAS